MFPNIVLKSFFMVTFAVMYTHMSVPVAGVCPQVIDIKHKINHL